jgi:hypothetical protein
VGNRWVYRIESRFGSGAYETWRIDRTEDAGGNTYAVVSIFGDSGVVGESFFRADDQDRVFLLTGSGEQLFLDARPAAVQGILQISSFRGQTASEVGTFADTISYSNRIDAFVLESGTLARGVGLLSSAQNLQAGSSGGFFSGRILVEAVVGGGAIRFNAPAAGLHVVMESLTFDLSNKAVANCARPCYFAACYLTPFPPDPPGTYKPCARARVGLENWPAGASRGVRLQLMGPAGLLLYDHAFTLAQAPGEVTITTQIPLFSEPSQPYPPGKYQLAVSTEDGNAQSLVIVQIR